MSPQISVNNRVRAINTHTHSDTLNTGQHAFCIQAANIPVHPNYIPSQTDLLLAGGGGGGGGCTSWIKWEKERKKKKWRHLPYNRQPNPKPPYPPERNLARGEKSFGARSREEQRREKIVPVPPHPTLNRVLVCFPTALSKNPPSCPYKAEPWRSHPPEVTSWLTAGGEKGAHPPDTPIVWTNGESAAVSLETDAP